jgi:hypothetical protein
LEFLMMPRTTFLALLLVVGLAAEARADLMVSTPSGIGGGQSFIVVFVDTTFGTAESTSIATYNGYIATAASGIKYSDGTISSWQILGATATADPAATVFNSKLPIYDLEGDKLGTSGSEWDSSGSTPDYNQAGSKVPNRNAWTGLQDNGSPAPAGYRLGEANPTYGYSNTKVDTVGIDTDYSPNSGDQDYYGFAIFTRAPEPSTFILALSGLISVGAGRLARRRRSASLPAESLPANS